MAWHGNHRDNWLCDHIGTPGDCQDQYGVWAPGLHDSCWMNDAFNIYAMSIEEERDRAMKIDEFITHLSQADNPNDPNWQLAVARRVGIYEFSPAEQEYVETEVAKRWQYAH